MTTPPIPATLPLDGPAPGPPLDSVPPAGTALWVRVEGAWRQGIALGPARSNPRRVAVDVAATAGVQRWIVRLGYLRLRSPR